MTIVRIIQLVVWLALAGYLVLVNGANGQMVLPFLLPVPTGVAMFLAVAIGWLVAWLPSRGAVWRLRRQNGKLERQLTKIQELSGANGQKSATPVIPDRKPSLVERVRNTKADKSPEVPS